jgi:hypothetical protein
MLILQWDIFLWYILLLDILLCTSVTIFTTKYDYPCHICESILYIKINIVDAEYRIFMYAYYWICNIIVDNL